MDTQLTFEEVKAYIIENWKDQEAIATLVGKTITGPVENKLLVAFNWGDNNPTMYKCFVAFKLKAAPYTIERIKVWSGDDWTFTGFGWKMHMGYDSPKVDVGVDWRDLLNKAS